MLSDEVGRSPVRSGLENNQFQGWTTTVITIWYCFDDLDGAYHREASRQPCPLRSAPGYEWESGAGSFGCVTWAAWCSAAATCANSDAHVSLAATSGACRRRKPSQWTICRAPRRVFRPVGGYRSRGVRALHRSTGARLTAVVNWPVYKRWVRVRLIDRHTVSLSLLKEQFPSRRHHESNVRARRSGVGCCGGNFCQPFSSSFPPRSLRLPWILSR